MPDEPTVNIAAHLKTMAEARPFAPAIFFPDGRDRAGRVRYTHYTYRQLDDASDRIARGLPLVGVPRGTRVALMVRPSLELFALVFGLFKAGVVPVMIDPGIGLKNMKSCLAKARPEAFIGIPTAQLARFALRWARESVKTVITVGPRGPFGGLTLADVMKAGDAEGSRSGDRPGLARGAEGDASKHRELVFGLEQRAERGCPKTYSALAPTKADEVAAVLFTSGSTGPPKGAVYTHGNFAAQVEAIRAMYAIEPGEIDLPTFPLFALFDPALGMTTVVPDMDPTRPAQADPVKIIEAIEDFGITNMFGSPALLNTLGRYGEQHGTRLPSLARVISAGAPVPTHVLRRVRAMLPENGQVVTPYGATECLPVATVESREVLGETAAKTAQGSGVCVGRPVPDADVIIIAIDDAPIASMEDATPVPAGQIGEITVRGPQATARYFEAEAQTRAAKIDDDGRVRHRMGDVGYLDEDGRLWFCGRKSQRVQHDGKTWFTGVCEGVFNAHPDVFRTALVGVPGKGPVMCVEVEASERVHREAIVAELRELAPTVEATRSIDTFLVHPGFPVDIRHNAKIKREQLAQWAAKELS